MVLHRQILFSLAIAAIAEVILMWASAEQVPSLRRVAPSYLKLVTSSNFWPFMLISALMVFVLLVVILLFSVLTSIPYAVALSTSLLVRSWSSPLLPPIRSMSSANRSCIWAFHRWRWIRGGHGKFPAWSSPGTSWTGRVRVRIPDGHLLLFWRTPLADSSRGLHCWSSHIVSEWLESILPLCWNVWGPTAGLHARLCQTPTWSLRSCRWWLYYWRSVLLCSGLVSNLLFLLPTVPQPWPWVGWG